MSSCSETPMQDDDNSEQNYLIKCDFESQLKKIFTLIESPSRFDSVLGVLDVSYLPTLIQIQHTCPDSFEDLSIKVLLRCHKEEVDKGYNDGVLISNKAYDYLCLLLFQSSYMNQSQNFASSSRTNEIFNWAKKNKGQLSGQNQAYLSEIEAEN